MIPLAMSAARPYPPTSRRRRPPAASFIAAGIVVAAASIAACETPPAASPSQAAQGTPSGATPSPAWDGGRAIVFTDRKKEAVYQRGMARLAAIRKALMGAALSSAEASALGFDCASLRADQDALRTEEDPIVQRFIADVTMTCRLDVPLAESYAELRDLEQHRQKNESVKSSCLGLKVALGDFGADYRENPTVTQIASKYAAYCKTIDE